MADSYCASSTVWNISEASIPKAKEILCRLEAGDDFCGAYLSGSQICIEDDMCFNPEATEALARILVDELEIDHPLCCYWSFSCSKLRHDHFSGGAFVLKRGFKTEWIDVIDHVSNFIADNKFVSMDT